MKVTPYPRPLPGFPITYGLTPRMAVDLRLVVDFGAPPFGTSEDPRHPYARYSIVRCPKCGRTDIEEDSREYGCQPYVRCACCGARLGIRLPDGTHSPFFF
jgi:hypothetical protein